MCLIGGVYMAYIIKKTTDLTSTEMIQIFQERIKVFVVEQNCPYQEVDELDYEAVHIILKDEENFIAYTRVIEEKDCVRLGRILVNQNFRRNNYGRQIIDRAINYVTNHSTKEIVKISAQARLVSFYETFGFKSISEVYLEDEIPHIDMVLKL